MAAYGDALQLAELVPAHPKLPQEEQSWPLTPLTSPPGQATSSSLWAGFPTFGWSGCWETEG